MGTRKKENLLLDFTLKILATIAGLILFLVPPAQATVYQLFSNHQGSSDFVENYDRIVESLRAGDEVVFSNGNKLILGEKLGQGNVTAVFAIKEDNVHVLRIPLAKEIVDPNTGLARYPRKNLRSFEKGQSTLSAHHVPVVTIFSSLDGEYLIVDRLEVHAINFLEFIQSYRNLPEQIRHDAIEAMDQFVAATAPFEVIGDLHQRNLVYEPIRKRWIIMDLNDKHWIVSGNELNNSKTTIFNDLSDAYSEIQSEFESKLLGKLIERWKNIIYTARNVGQKTCSSILINN